MSIINSDRVHAAHCCTCSCKYGDQSCPVVARKTHGILCCSDCEGGPGIELDLSHRVKLRATPSRYQWTYRGVSFDFYRLCQITGVTSDPGKHAMKKIIRAGRSVKTLRQDVVEARDALNRWIEMIDEDDADQPKQTTPE